MMLESKYFIYKIESTSSERGTVGHIEEILYRIQDYMVLKALISMFKALIVWIVLVIV